jgi:hypothetical protein
MFRFPHSLLAMPIVAAIAGTDLAPGAGLETGTLGAWRLVRTPNPQGGADTVSIMHTSDMLRSDPDLAGLMLRCVQSDIQAIVVLIQPFPLRARPQITISAGGTDRRFETTVIPPGAAILLPREAEMLMTGPWQTLAEVSIDVNYDPVSIRGVIALAGLPAALITLRANCPSQ